MKCSVANINKFAAVNSDKKFDRPGESCIGLWGEPLLMDIQCGNQRNGYRSMERRMKLNKDRKSQKKLHRSIEVGKWKSKVGRQMAYAMLYQSLPAGRQPKKRETICILSICLHLSSYFRSTKSIKYVPNSKGPIIVSSDRAHQASSLPRHPHRLHHRPSPQQGGSWSKVE